MVDVLLPHEDPLSVLVGPSVFSRTRWVKIKVGVYGAETIFPTMSGLLVNNPLKNKLE